MEGMLMGGDRKLTELVAEIRPTGRLHPWVSWDVQHEEMPPAEVVLQEAAEETARRADRQARLLKADRLAVLWRRQQLALPEMRAALELRDIVQWTEGDMAPLARSQFNERMAASTGISEDQLWLNRIEAEHTRYAPWRSWAAAFPVQMQPVRSSIEDLTRAIVVEGIGLRQCSDRMRMHYRRALPLLRRSLHWYARRAGWVTAENPAEIPA